MPALIDLTGLKFNRLTVIGRHPAKKRQAYWSCKCDCGSITKAGGFELKTGIIKSCGCFNREAASEYRRSHGMTQTAIYKVWTGIKQRCTNPNNIGWKNYGGRGILICDKWLDFGGFLNDMGGSYSPGLSIERIDNNGPYCKSNCKWATINEQAYNKRSTRYIQCGGIEMLAKDWAEVMGVTPHLIFSRLSSGWSEDRAIRQPKRK